MGESISLAGMKKVLYWGYKVIPYTCNYRIFQDFTQKTAIFYRISGGGNMTDKKIEALITKTVKQAFKELKDKGALKSQTELIYKDISKLLRCYYRDLYDSGSGDSKIENAISQLKDDRFFMILENYYGMGFTLEELAGRLHCDISTITRNKKRLCFEIYELMEEED